MIELMAYITLGALAMQAIKIVINLDLSAEKKVEAVTGVLEIYEKQKVKLEETMTEGD